MSMGHELGRCRALGSRDISVRRGSAWSTLFVTTEIRARRLKSGSRQVKLRCAHQPPGRHIDSRGDCNSSHFFAGICAPLLPVRPHVCTLGLTFTFSDRDITAATRVNGDSAPAVERRDD